jgi:hypothetical protein
MNAQCATTGFAEHASCRQRRLADQAREAQQSQRN